MDEREEAVCYIEELALDYQTTWPTNDCNEIIGTFAGYFNLIEDDPMVDRRAISSMHSIITTMTQHENQIKDPDAESGTSDMFMFFETTVDEWYPELLAQMYRDPHGPRFTDDIYEVLKNAEDTLDEKEDLICRIEALALDYMTTWDLFDDEDEIITTFTRYFELVQDEPTIDKRVALSIHVIFTVYNRNDVLFTDGEKAQDQALEIQAFLAKEMAK